MQSGVELAGVGSPIWLNQDTKATSSTKPEGEESGADCANDGANMPAPVTIESQGSFHSVPLGSFPPVYYDPADMERRKKKQLELLPSELLTPAFAVYRLQKILAQTTKYGLPGTRGDKVECFKQYLMNEHSILGVFMAHPLNPFDQMERRAFLLTMWTWGFFTTTFLTYITNWKLVRELGEPVCVQKPDTKQVKRTLIVLVTMLLITLLKKILRLFLSCSIFHNTEYGRGAKFKRNFKLIEKCGKVEGYIVFILGFILCISAIVVINRCNHYGGSMDIFVPFIIAQLSSTFGSELAQMVALFYWYFDADKEEFECVHACQFPAGSPPTDMTQVALRAKENFMWDPILYGRFPNGTTDQKLNRANALTSFNARFGVFYETAFGVGFEEGVKATTPHGLVEGVKVA